MSSPRTDSAVTLRTWRWWTDPLVSGLVALAISMLVFGPILGHLGDSWGPGDMLSHYVNVANWSLLGYQPTIRFGFPGGMDLNLVPGIDITQNTAAALIYAITGNVFTGLNAVIILSFPVCAALAVTAFRLVGLTGWWAIALAQAFTFIPYHFGRVLGHTYLGLMYAAITGVMLALLIGNGRMRTWPTSVPTWLAMALLIVVTAWSNVYYLVFGVILMGAALITRVIRGDTAAQLLRASTLPIATAVLGAIGYLPALWARHHESMVGDFAARSAYESVTLAGNLAMALLPAPLSELPRMGYYNEAVRGLVADAPLTEATADTNWGTWITTAALIFSALWAVWRLRRHQTLPKQFTLVATLMLAALLFFIPWGLNALVAEFITAQIRGWNRLLPTLLLLTLLLAGVALAHTPRLLTKRSVAIGASVVIAVVVIEQVLPFQRIYASTAQRFAQDSAYARDYAEAIDTEVPGKCGVLQLPAMVYPENGRVEPELNDYEHFWLPLTNQVKDFSYGAVRFTTSAEMVPEVTVPITEAEIGQLEESGFCGIHVDTRGYPNKELSGLVENLTALTGGPATRGHDGEWLFFALPGTP